MHLNFIVILSCTCTPLLTLQFLSNTLHYKSSGTPDSGGKNIKKEEGRVANEISTTPKCIDKRSKNWLDWKVHITTKTQAYDLFSLLFNIIVFVEGPSCFDGKYNIIKLWWRISFSQFECVFVTGLKRQDQVNLLYLMLIIIIEKKTEVNCLYKTRWDSYT